MDWYSWLSKSALEPSLIYEYGLAFSRNELQKEDLAYFNHEFLQSMGISVAKHRLEILKLARKEVGETPNSLSKLILAINKTRKCVNKYVNKLVQHENNAIKPQSDPVRYRDQWRGALTRKCKSEKELKIEQPVPRTRKIAKSGPLDCRVQEKLLAPPRNLKLSGPLDRKMQEKLVFNYRSPITSGPINIAMAEERLMLTNRSPKLTAPLNYVRPPSPKVLGDYSKERAPPSPKVLGDYNKERAPPSPKVHGDYNKEKADGDYGDHTLWAALFQDMKPT